MAFSFETLLTALVSSGALLLCVRKFSFQVSEKDDDIDWHVAFEDAYSEESE